MSKLNNSNATFLVNTVITDSSLRLQDCKMSFWLYFKPFKAKYGLIKCNRLVCMFRATSPKQGWKFLLVTLFDLGTISLKPFLDLCVALIWIILVTWVVAPHALNLTFVTHVTPHSLHSLQSLRIKQIKEIIYFNLLQEVPTNLAIHQNHGKKFQKVRKKIDFYFFDWPIALVTRCDGNAAP